LEKRAKQMDYPRFQAEGWPIGSGIVESGNKLVVEARLKGAGMHCAGAHVDAMLALRNVICSDRWKEEWPKVASQLRWQKRQKQAQLHVARRKPHKAEQHNRDRTVPERKLAATVQPIKPALPEPIQKHKENPWRRFKFGRALYQRKDPPKN
jgi:hypothetical protein